LFVPLGVNPFLLLGLRLGTALMLTVALAHAWRGPAVPEKADRGEMRQGG